MAVQGKEDEGLMGDVVSSLQLECQIVIFNTYIFIAMQCNGKAPIPEKCALFGIGFVLCICVSSLAGIPGGKLVETHKTPTIKKHKNNDFVF